MPRPADYMVGSIDTTIQFFLTEIPDPTSSMAYALITYLDSSPEVAAIFAKSKQLKHLKGCFETVGQGVLLPTRQLLAAEKKNRIFFGFDEVWFFPSADVTPKPTRFVITGPDPINTHEVQEYSEWLRSNNCSLGLGDGCGLNYCLRVRGVAGYIVEALNEASQSSIEHRGETA